MAELDLGIPMETYEQLGENACMNDELICFRSSNDSFRLVLLHGWGADAEDLVPIARTLTQVNECKFELVFLRAPHQHPDGVGRQWYELFPPNWETVPPAVDHLRNRVEALATSLISLERTVLMGFSQGGAMAIASGCGLPIAGVIGCSAYPHPGWSPPIQIPPVLLTHGIGDEVVPCEASRKLIKALKTSRDDCELEVFDGGHEIHHQVIKKIQKKLQVWTLSN